MISVLFGSVFILSYLPTPPPTHTHLIIMQGVETGTRGGELSSRAVAVFLGGGGGLDWGGSRGVTRTTTGDNPRTVPCDETPDSQHGCPSLISAGLPQSPRSPASVGHLTRRPGAPLALFSASCATLSGRVKSRLPTRGIRRVTFMLSPPARWPVCSGHVAPIRAPLTDVESSRRRVFYFMALNDCRPHLPSQ